MSRLKATVRLERNLRVGSFTVNKTQHLEGESVFKVEVLRFKCFVVFLENLVLGTFICADNESK